VYRGIKELLLQYGFRPGERLVAQELAERFHVSRTPIGQALARLEQEGYVLGRPNRGYQVAEIQPGEAVELFGLREALEAFTVELAASSAITPAMHARLRDRMEEYEQLTGEPLLSRRKLLLDYAFHIAIAELAGNTKITEILTRTFERLIMKRKIEGVPSRGMVTVREHGAIYSALTQGDGVRAAALIRQHVRSSRDNLLQHLKMRQALFEDDTAGQPVEEVRL
jgi:DNA-binding GntR family transcriptional regulator